MYVKLAMLKQNKQKNKRSFLEKENETVRADRFETPCLDM